MDQDELTVEDMMDYIKNVLFEGDEEAYNDFLKWATDPLRQALIKTIERIGNERL